MKKKYQLKKSQLKKNLKVFLAKRKKAAKDKLDLVLQIDRKLTFKDQQRLKQEEKELLKRKKKLRKLKMPSQKKPDKKRLSSEGRTKKRLNNLMYQERLQKLTAFFHSFLLCRLIIY